MIECAWWETAYVLTAVFVFGWSVSLPAVNNRTGRPLRPVTNIVVSAAMAAWWPVTALVMVGVVISEKDRRR